MAFGDPYLGLNAFAQQQAHLIEQERQRQIFAQQQDSLIRGLFGGAQNALAAPSRDQDDDLLLLLTGD